MQHAILANRYQLAEPVGVGAMGTVYRAQDLRTGGTVAVKLLHPTLAHDPKYTARLKREARLAAAMTSPRVVRVIDLGEHEGTPFLVMEYVAGETLADVLRARGRLPAGEALIIALEVARALEAAHARGIVHRDLKPQNIKLVDGQIKVLDFGIARADGDAALTMTGVYLGTPAYSAPERWSGRGDIRADIYSVGVVLYELIAGRPPVPAWPPAAAQLPRRRPLPPPLPGNAPREAHELVARCLARDPRDRYQTPADLRAACEAALQALDGHRSLPSESPAGGRGTAGASNGAAVSGTVELPDAARVPNNLPPAVSSFVGRAREVAEVKRRLPIARMLTLTSAAGCGKTRLALQVACELLDQYPDGVWLVELAPLADPALAPQAVAAALRARETQGRPLVESLVEHLSGRSLLLVLDNCEHMLAACRDLAETLLDACPGLHILATSREVLGVTDEVVYSVPSLALPDPRHLQVEEDDLVSVVSRCDAAELFVERARARDAGFELTAANARAVAGLCRRLDGIPLVLELAAPLVRTMAVEQIVAQLDDRIRFISGAGGRALSREQIVRLALDWSHDLLTPPERALFRRLAAFAGSFDGESVDAVCSTPDLPAGRLPSLLARLEEAALLRRTGEAARPRYQLLESMRQYAGAHLQAAGEAAAVHERHVVWCLELAERAEPELVRSDQQRWLERLELDHDNLRAALGWSLADPRGGTGLRLTGALWRFWNSRGHYAEGRRWLEQFLIAGRSEDPLTRAKALYGAGVLAAQQGAHEPAHAWLEECLALRRGAGDTAGTAAALGGLGNVAWARGHLAEARGWYEDSLRLRRELGDTAEIASILNNLGTLASDQGDYRLAHERHEQSLALRRELKDANGVALSTHNLGEVAYRRGDHAEACRLFREGLSMAWGLRNRAFVAGELGGLARVAQATGRPHQAARLFGAAEALRDALGIPLARSDRATFEPSIAAARAALGDPAFAAAEADGAALPLDHVITEALTVEVLAETHP